MGWIQLVHAQLLFRAHHRAWPLTAIGPRKWHRYLTPRRECVGWRITNTLVKNPCPNTVQKVSGIRTPFGQSLGGFGTRNVSKNVSKTCPECVRISGCGHVLDECGHVLDVQNVSTMCPNKRSAVAERICGHVLDVQNVSKMCLVWRSAQCPCSDPPYTNAHNGKTAKVNLVETWLLGDK